MALSAGSPQSTTISRFLNRMKYAFTDVADDITTAATGDKLVMLDASDNYNPKYADGDNVLEAMGVTATAAELNGLDADLASNVLTRGAGVDTAESYGVGIRKVGSLFVTTIVIDISTLIGSATDNDIIGESGAASCHWGQITAAKSGTIIGGKVTCLEVPAGGTADINFYSANESTGTQDALATGLTETVLIDAGGAWTSGATKGMTTVPPANDYLYLANGAASGGTFSAGKFEIVLYGV